MIFGISKYAGIWESEDGFRLDIKTISDTSALVSIYDSNCQPYKRTYFNDKPTINLNATYDDYLGEFRVDLWNKNKGFELILEYEHEYDLDEFKRDALIPALSRNEEYKFLNNYYEIFGTLRHLVKIERIAP